MAMTPTYAAHIRPNRRPNPLVTEQITLQQRYLLRYPFSAVVPEVSVCHTGYGRWADEDSRISYSKIIACFTARRHAVVMPESYLIQIARRYRDG